MSFFQKVQRQLLSSVKNKTVIMKIEIFFLLTAIIGFFFIYPPSFNYGDHASYGLIFQENLIRYIENKGFQGSFDDFVRNNYKFFHGDKLSSIDVLESYGLDKEIQLEWILLPNYYSVYVLSRLSTLAIHYLTLGKFNVETCETVFSVLVYLLTYIYAYKFGKFFLDKKFGLALAVVTIGNIYFNQLARSTMNPFNLVFPMLLCASLYYLFKLHHIEQKNKIIPSLGLTVVIAFNFLNGYPSTNVLILCLLFLAFLILIVNIFLLKNKEYRILPTYCYFIIFYSSFSLIIVTSAFWSNLLGQPFYYAFNNILHDRVWGQLLRGQLTPDPYQFEIWQIPYILPNTFQVLFFGSKALIGPHEPSFLLSLSFFNLFESLMFILGIATIIKNFFSKKIIYQLLSLLFIFFIYRLFTNSANYLVVGRYTADFYFVTIFFTALGFYKMFDYLRFKNKNLKTKLLFILLFVSLLTNIKIFNEKFIMEYDESLRQSSGLYELRQLYKNEISKDKNLFITDYQKGNYLYHIDLISLLNNKTDYEVYNKFFSDNNINSLDSFKNFLEKSPYKNVYVLIPVGISQWGGTLMYEVTYNFHQNIPKFSKYFSQYQPYRTIKNRRGIPKFWIYKFSKKHYYYTLELNKEVKSYTIDLKGNQKISFIDIPGSVDKMEINFDNRKKLNLTFNDYYYDRFHFSFDENSFVDIFNNFNFSDRINNIIESEVTREPAENHDGVLINFLSPINFPSNLTFKYKLNYPIKKAYYSVPFVFYNDQLLQNEFSVFYKTGDSDKWKLSDSKKSNGNLRFTDYDFYLGFGYYPRVYPHTYYNFFNVVYPKMSNSFFMKYKIASVFAQSVKPYSSFFRPENTMNFLKFEIDTGKYRKYKEISIKKIILKIKFKDFQKENSYNVISIGTKL